MNVVFSKYDQMDGISLKVYFAAISTWILGTVVWLDTLGWTLKIIAAIGGAFVTWYTIKKYRSDHALNEEKLKREQLEIRRLEMDIEVKEMQKKALENGHNI